jgi:hypothetical protein
VETSPRRPSLGRALAQASSAQVDRILEQGFWSIRDEVTTPAQVLSLRSDRR